MRIEFKAKEIVGLARSARDAIVRTRSRRVAELLGSYQAKMDARARLPWWKRMLLRPPADPRGDPNDLFSRDLVRSESLRAQKTFLVASSVVAVCNGDPEQVVVLDREEFDALCDWGSKLRREDEIPE